jgi:hypothetical protein
MNTLFPLPRTRSDPAVSNAASAEPTTAYPTVESVASEIGVILVVTLVIAFAVTFVLRAYGIE